MAAEYRLTDKTMLTGEARANRFDVDSDVGGLFDVGVRLVHAAQVMQGVGPLPGVMQGVHDRPGIQEVQGRLVLPGDGQRVRVEILLKVTHARSIMPLPGAGRARTVQCPRMGGDRQP